MQEKYETLFGHVNEIDCDWMNLVLNQILLAYYQFLKIISWFGWF